MTVRAHTALDALRLAIVDLAAADSQPRCGEFGGSELWLSDDAEDRALAASWCTGCPVLDLCHTAAVEGRERFGVWGGMDRTVTATRPASAQMTQVGSA